MNVTEPLPQDRSRPPREIPRLWPRIAFGMTELFLAEEADRSSTQGVVFGITVLALSTTTLAAISLLLVKSLRVGPASADILVVLLGRVLLGTVLGFGLVNGVMYAASHLLRGEGSMVTQAYLVSVISVPLVLVSGLLGMVLLAAIFPARGFYRPSAVILSAAFAAAMGLYAVLLFARVLRVVHGLGTGKAIAAVLGAGVLAGLILALLLPAIRSGS